MKIYRFPFVAIQMPDLRPFAGGNHLMKFRRPLPFAYPTNTPFFRDGYSSHPEIGPGRGGPAADVAVTKPAGPKVESRDIHIADIDIDEVLEVAHPRGMQRD